MSRQKTISAISWLIYSKIIGSCDLYNNGKIVDTLHERRIHFMGCGMANFIARSAVINNEALAGLITETFAYTELYRLYAYNNIEIKGNTPACAIYNNYELDFVIIDNKYGLEVKTSNSNKPKSLNVFLEKGLIDEAYLAGLTRRGKRKTIKAIPIYTIGCRFPYK